MTQFSVQFMPPDHSLAIEPNDRECLWCKALGFYFGIEAQRLRLFTVTGELILLPEEAERQRADAAEANVAELLAHLKQTGLE